MTISKIVVYDNFLQYKGISREKFRASLDAKLKSHGIIADIAEGSKTDCLEFHTDMPKDIDYRYFGNVIKAIGTNIGAATIPSTDSVHFGTNTVVGNNVFADGKKVKPNNMSTNIESRVRQIIISVMEELTGEKTQDRF
jgi:hypothetical protein